MSEPGASTLADNASSLAVIDETVLAALSDDLGESMMPSLIETFLSELDTLVASLAASFDHADFAAAAAHAHALKGSAATFGAVRLEVAALEIERAGVPLTVEAAADQLAQLTRLTSEVAEALQRRYPTASQPDAAD